MLTTDQIDSFKQNGFLILRSVIEPVVIDVWRRCFWERIDANPNDPSTWRGKPHSPEGFQMVPAEAALNRHPKVVAAITQLGGGNFVGDSGPPLVNWPQEGKAWSPTKWGHVDAYPPTFWYPFMLAATAYAYDVEPMGGGFTYWPQSHHTTHKRFLANPEMIDGKWAREPDFDWGGPNEFTQLAPLPPREFTAGAGDVILWHSFLVHTGSLNIRNSPRIGYFSRFRHKDQEAIKHEVPANLWKYWAV